MSDILQQVQRAWDSVLTVPDMDWTESEAQQFMTALQSISVAERQRQRALTIAHSSSPLFGKRG